MPRAELTQGDKLCRAYVARVCACAADNAPLQKQCDMAKAQPEALSLHYGLLSGQKGKLNDYERRMTESAIRKTVSACVNADGALDPNECPRTTAF